MTKRLMILGSLSEFVQMVQMARERGIYTIVCDQYIGGAAKQYADAYYDIPVTETEEIAELCKREEVDGIITSFSDKLLECMVKIADAAGIPTYLRPEQLPYYRNKDITKKTLKALGLGTPKGVCLKSDYQDTELEGIEYPVVIKPLDLYGSRGVRVLDSKEEIRAEFAQSCTNSQLQELLVEEYNIDPEFNMMTWVLHGKVHVLSIADREKTYIAPHEIPISSRNVYPSKYIHQVYQEATALLQKYIETTGQQDGALSMQFFWSPQRGIQVCEIAARFFGYEHELVEYACGLSIEKLLLDSVYDRKSLEETLASYTPWGTKCCCVIYFQGRPLTIADQSKARAISTWPQVRLSQQFYKDGDTVDGSQPYVTRYYLEAPTREEIDHLSQKLINEVTITDSEGKEILYKGEGL